MPLAMSFSTWMDYFMTIVYAQGSVKSHFAYVNESRC